MGMNVTEQTQSQQGHEERQTVALEGIAFAMKAMLVLGLIAAAIWFVVLLVA